jgi:HAD superfamily hydrolase (TIGR01662 family)
MGILRAKSDIPYETHEHAGVIPYQSFRDRGIETLILDKDGTLTHANAPQFVDKVIEGMLGQGIAGIFPRIAIVSNNHDPRAVQNCALGLSELLGLQVVAFSRDENTPRKPDASMGFQVAESFGVEPHKIAVIGDRLLTDVEFGRNLGAGIIALTDKVGEGDARWVPVIRPLERAMTWHDGRRGLVQHTVQLKID